MMEIIKSLIFGVVEGITEWLPISSTGHMILLNEFLTLNQSAEFTEVFFVVIQLGAILAVALLFFNKIFPFQFGGGPVMKKETLSLWMKILAASIPAGVVGVLFDDYIDALFYNYVVVSVALIVFGILFIVIENKNKGRLPKTNSIASLTYQQAFLIGLFQLIAAVFPGTSRSGATILGALLIGISRTVAAEFTFFLAIPAMAGASLLKLLKYGFSFTATEYSLLLFGMAAAFLVSVVAIRFLMDYIKGHDFKVFGVYRIILGSLVLLYFAVL